jgi:hypothetical protein
MRTVTTSLFMLTVLLGCAAPRHVDRGETTPFALVMTAAFADRHQAPKSVHLYPADPAQWKPQATAVLTWALHQVGAQPGDLVLNRCYPSDFCLTDVIRWEPGERPEGDPLTEVLRSEEIARFTPRLAFCHAYKTEVRCTLAPRL